MFVVYWSVVVDDQLVPQSKIIEGPKEMTEALAFMKELRDGGARCVTYVQENSECVTKPGVDSIVDGKTPDGHKYEWNKRRGDPPELRQ